MSTRRDTRSFADALILIATATMLLILAACERQPAITRIEKTSQAAGPYSNVFCLVVGNNKYPAGYLNTLRYAERDAIDVAHVLSNRFGFKVVLLIGTNATKINIERHFRDLLSRLQPEDDFIFYFSGEGATQDSAEDPLARNGYLVPFGTTLTSAPSLAELESQALNGCRLAQELRSSRGRHRIMLLDSCFSGYAASGGEVRRISLDSTVTNLFAEPSVQMLTAGTAADRLERARAFEREAIDTPSGPKPIEHGIFTYALLQILKQDQSQPIISLFLQLRSQMQDLQTLASDSGALSTPQLRLLSPERGDFIFVPSILQGRFLIPFFSAPEIAMSKGAVLSEPVTVVEFLEAFNRLERHEPLTSEETKRYWARFSMGDPAAGAILTEAYGRDTGAKSPQKAIEVARLVYEMKVRQDGIDYGALALSRCYENAWGVEKDPALADRLRARSGFGSFYNALVAGAAAPTRLTAPTLLQYLPPAEINLADLMPAENMIENLQSEDFLLFIPRIAAAEVNLHEGPTGSEKATNLVATLRFGVAYRFVGRSDDNQDLQIRPAATNGTNSCWIHGWKKASSFATLRLPQQGLAIPHWRFVKVLDDSPAPAASPVGTPSSTNTTPASALGFPVLPANTNSGAASQPASNSPTAPTLRKTRPSAPYDLHRG